MEKIQLHANAALDTLLVELLLHTAKIMNGTNIISRHIGMIKAQVWDMLGFRLQVSIDA